MALIVKLGTLLQLARSLDISETQPVQELHIHYSESTYTLNLQLVCALEPLLELKEILRGSQRFRENVGN